MKIILVLCSPSTDTTIKRINRAVAWSHDHLGYYWILSGVKASEYTEYMLTKHFIPLENVFTDDLSTNQMESFTTTCRLVSRWVFGSVVVCTSTSEIKTAFVIATNILHQYKVEYIHTNDIDDDQDDIEVINISKLFRANIVIDNTEAIVVLGNKSDNVMKNRVNRASKLYHQLKRANSCHYNELVECQPEPLLICSGGCPNNDGETEATRMYNFAVKEDINPVHIILEDKSRTTFENIKNIKQILEETFSTVDKPHITICSSEAHITRVILLSRLLLSDYPLAFISSDVNPGDDIGETSKLIGLINSYLKL